MKKKSLLDSFAILAWIQDEKGAQQVEDLLYLAQDTFRLHRDLLLARRRGKADARKNNNTKTGSNHDRSYDSEMVEGRWR